MSCRQAEKNSVKVTKVTKGTKGRRNAGRASVTFVSFVSLFLISNSGNLPWFQGFQEPSGSLEIELRVRRLDAEEEPVAARQRESRQVEYRVIRHRQAVER